MSRLSAKRLLVGLAPRRLSNPPKGGLCPPVRPVWRHGLEILGEKVIRSWLNEDRRQVIDRQAGLH